MAMGFKKDWNDFVNNWNKFWNWLGKDVFGGMFGGDKPTMPGASGSAFQEAANNSSSGSGFVSVPGSSPIDYITGSAQAQEQYNYNLALQQQAQTFNSAEAEKQRQWEERMSNTAYQRGMADMKAAGLNPWLMVQGSAASTASGSSASSSAASVTQRDNGAKTLGALVGSALSIAIIAKIVSKFIK